MTARTGWRSSVIPARDGHRPLATVDAAFASLDLRHSQDSDRSASTAHSSRILLGTGPRRVLLWSALVVSVLQASRTERVVLLHDLPKFVSRAADHLVLIVVVLDRATCGPVQDSLIKLTELRFWDIDVLGGPVRAVRIGLTSKCGIGSRPDRDHLTCAEDFQHPGQRALRAQQHQLTAALPQRLGG